MNVEKKVFNRKIEQMKRKRKRNASSFDNPNLEPLSNKKVCIDEEGEQIDLLNANKSADETTVLKSDRLINIEKPKDRNAILTDIVFESLRGRVSDRTLDSISLMGFSHMTEIQQKTIEPLLEVCISKVFFLYFNF